MTTAVSIAHDVATGATTASAALESSLATIAERNGEINAFLYVDTDRARAMAASVDERLAAGETVGPLAGVPIAIKENMLSLIHI